MVGWGGGGGGGGGGYTTSALFFRGIQCGNLRKVKGSQLGFTVGVCVKMV